MTDAAVVAATGRILPTEDLPPWIPKNNGRLQVKVDDHHMAEAEVVIAEDDPAKLTNKVH